MAIEFFTGFEGCGTSADIISLFDAYSTTANYVATGGYNNTKRVSMSGAGTYLRKNVPSGYTKVWGAHLINLGLYAYSTSLDRAFFYYTETGVTITIWNTSTGIDVRLGTTQVAFYSGITIPNTVTHVEVKIVVHSSTGSIEIKINGTSLGAITGLNTGSNPITYMQVKGHYNNTTSYDNFFIADDWQGELISILSKPSSDDSVQFTPSTGTDNYAMVDDIAQDGDSTYVESNTVGHTDLYNYEDVPSGYTVKAVSLVTVARKDDAGARTLQPIVNQDSVEYNAGGEIALSTSYPSTTATGSIITLGKAPDGTDWNNTKFNNIRAGFKIAS